MPRRYNSFKGTRPDRRRVLIGFLTVAGLELTDALFNHAPIEALFKGFVGLAGDAASIPGTVGHNVQENNYYAAVQQYNKDLAAYNARVSVQSAEAFVNAGVNSDGSVNPGAIFPPDTEAAIIRGNGPFGSGIVVKYPRHAVKVKGALLVPAGGEDVPSTLLHGDGNKVYRQVLHVLDPAHPDARPVQVANYCVDRGDAMQLPADGAQRDVFIVASQTIEHRADGSIVLAYDSNGTPVLEYALTNDPDFTQPPVAPEKPQGL